MLQADVINFIFELLPEEYVTLGINNPFGRISRVNFQYNSMFTCEMKKLG